ncbi:MAG: MoxR family ATPase [Candidatus Latescibacteria bacterium]|nr:MoxR family ATPase [Candidatus Latescibacterota bacterium]
MTTHEATRFQQLLEAQAYIADRQITMSVYLATSLRKPLLVEGPAGVGKTEIAKVMARALSTDLIRLQCYEGLDANTALYEWNYQRQLLHIKLEESGHRTVEEKEATIFSEPFLMKRPLLQAITHHQAPVLLIDELDRADEEFESFLLEMLSEWQITIPEIGTIRATHLPYVVITSNRTRELSDAVRRRCFYMWIDYPAFDKELAIVRGKVADIDARLAEQICRFMELIRRQKLEKIPGVAETLDWARALVALHQKHLDFQVVEETLGLVFKDWNDIRQMKESLAEFLEGLGIHSTLTPALSQAAQAPLGP